MTVNSSPLTDRGSHNIDAYSEAFLIVANAKPVGMNIHKVGIKYVETPSKPLGLLFLCLYNEYL